jgi:hypothetical protein
MASMSNTVPVPDTGVSEPAATTTAAEQQAKDFLDGFRALVATKLPKIDLPHPLTIPLARRHRNVPVSFAKTVADMAAANPDLQAIKQYDAGTNKADQQQIDAFVPIAQELSTVLKAISFSVGVKKAKTNTAAVQMQAFIEALSKDPAYAHLIPALDAIKQARAPKKSKAKSGPQQPGGPSPEPSQNGGPLLTH